MDEHANTAARAVVNSLLSMGSGGLTVCAGTILAHSDHALSSIVNGVLAGAVANCAGADVLDAWAAIVVGVVAGGVQMAWSRLLQR